MKFGKKHTYSQRFGSNHESDNENGGVTKSRDVSLDTN